MDINRLVTQYSTLRFVPDGKDATGAFMLIDDYKIHVRQDDVAIAVGLPMSDVHPLIDRLIRIEP